MKRRFFYHYNKPKSKQMGKPILSVHQSGVCHFVESVTCYTPTETRNNKRQPRCVVQGYGVVSIKGKKAVIT